MEPGSAPHDAGGKWIIKFIFGDRVYSIVSWDFKSRLLMIAVINKPYLTLFNDKSLQLSIA